MSPERLDDIWWLFLPGEQFTDSRGRKVINDSGIPLPIRVHSSPDGLLIQARGKNYSIEGVKDFMEAVKSTKQE